MIKLITFKTNQTIMAEIVRETDLTLTVKYTVQVINVPSPNGQPESSQLAFSPFLEYSEEFRTGVTFNMSDILTVNSPVQELVNQYNQIFGSGITIASTLPKS